MFIISGMFCKGGADGKIGMLAQPFVRPSDSGPPSGHGEAVALHGSDKRAIDAKGFSQVSGRVEFGVWSEVFHGASRWKRLRGGDRSLALGGGHGEMAETTLFG